MELFPLCVRVTGSPVGTGQSGMSGIGGRLPPLPPAVMPLLPVPPMPAAPPLPPPLVVPLLPAPPLPDDPAACLPALPALLADAPGAPPRETPEPPVVLEAGAWPPPSPPAGWCALHPSDAEQPMQMPQSARKTARKLDSKSSLRIRDPTAS